MNEKLVLMMRIVLGAIFLVFGLNGFLAFIPMPPMNASATNFMTALAATGYFFPLLKLTEIVSGVLLITGKMQPLALLLLAPIVINIFFFHLLLSGTGLVFASMILVLHILLMIAHKESFLRLFD